MKIIFFSVIRWAKAHQFIVCFCIFFILLIILFWQFFLKGYIPVPANILVGAYYPWFSYNWGYPVHVPVKNPLMSDVISLMYPWRLTAINYLKQGHLPLWDPSSFLGLSLIGNFQAGIFNPFNLLFFLPINFAKIWGFQVIIQNILAFIAMYVLLRHWKLKSLATFLGATAYAFSSILIVWQEYNVHGFAIALFPLNLYLIDLLIYQTRYMRWIWLSFLYALIIFFGYPQYLYYYFGFAVVYMVLLLLAEHQFYRIGKLMLFYLLSVILGIGVAGVQVLPGFESLKLSIRDLDKVANGNNVIFLPLQQLVMLFIPDFFGNPATGNYWGAGYYESFVFYGGMVATSLALLAFHKPIKKQVLILMSFILIGVILSIRDPLSELIQNLSFLGLSGSVSSRILFIVPFAVCTLAAFGFDWLIKNHQKKLRNILGWQEIIPFLISGIGIGVIFTLQFVFKGFLLHLVNLQDGNNVSIALRNSLYFLGILWTSTLIILIYLKYKLRILLLFLVLLLIIDQFHFAWKYLPFTAPNLIFPTTSSINFLQKKSSDNRIAVERAELMPANSWSLYGLENITGYNILLPKTTAQYISYLNYQKFDQAYARFLDIENFSSSLLDYASVNHIVALLRKGGVPDSRGTLPIDLQGKQYQKIYQEDSVVVLTNPGALPGIFSADSYKVENNVHKQIIDMAAQTAGKKVFLLSDPGLKNISPCTSTVVSQNGEQYYIWANCKNNGLLVVNQAFNNGWKVNVNGQKVPIMLANGNFIAIPLPPGQSKIDLYFLPDSFTYGLWISAISLLLFVVIWYMFVFKRQYENSFSS